MELGRIGQDSSGILDDMLANLNGGGERGPQQGEGFLDQARELHRSTGRFRAPTKREDLLHQCLGTLASLAYLLEMVPGGAVLGYIVEGQLSIAQDGGENIVKIVRNAPGQGANGFHLLGLTQLRFKPFALSNVPPGA